jgi:hypothetical protein
MDRLKYHDIDTKPETVRSFAEQLQKLIAEGTRFPLFFASTEY